jgi:hypothetical protein
MKSLVKINRSFLKNQLNELDNYEIDHCINPREHSKIYIEGSHKNLSVKRIEILDIIDLDQFSDLLKHIDRLFKTMSCKSLNGFNREMTFSEQSDMRQWISNAIDSYGSSSWGGLFKISNDKKSADTDLYDVAEFKCFKTRENLFIIKFEVTPSSKFHTIVDEILKTNIIPSDIPQFNPIKDFIKYRRIMRGWKAPGYPKEKAFNALLEDLIFQIKKELLSGFNGAYSSLENINPYIAVFNSTDELSFEDFKIGFGIITTRPCEIYYNESLNFFIINKAKYEENNCLYVIGDSDSFPEKYDQDKVMINYGLSLSLYPSWILLNYFKDYNTRITNLRKAVYGFINENRRFKFNKQIKIQTKLSRMKIFVNRVGIEFTDTNIDDYINSEDFDLNKMLPVNNSWGKDSSYYAMVQSNITYYLKEMKSQIIEVEEYFKEISNINLVKINLKIQIFILSISIIGLLLALSNIDKLFSLFKNIIDYIIKIVK